MMGEKIGEEAGKITGQRVLPGRSVKIESSFKSVGTLLGVPEQNVGTYEAEMRPDGTLAGHGQGVVMAKEGGGSAVWKAHGVGIPKPDGAIAYRGSIIFETQFSKWARINSCLVMVEYEVDAEGNARSKLFEWK